MNWQEAIRNTRFYCDSLTSYKRRKTREVFIGNIPVGGDNPIRVQSMTTAETRDTMASVDQAMRMADAGSEYVRLTAPSIKDAQNLENIKNELVKRGYTVPLIADIHFTPNAAEYAAKVVEKVRVNPGNYADKKKFQFIEYTDETYYGELERIRERFAPLVELCKQHGTAMRIGTNHGSLSDRIMSRYGDTPIGMVESALEFVRICEDLGYYDIVLSMKASNTQVMVQAYRLLVEKSQEEGLQPYPLHLGVTEAGEGEDGRIKSSVGIGTLLEDGLGDTIRVSLTEEPEEEVPVARKLADRYRDRSGHKPIPAIDHIPVNPFESERRKTHEVLNIGKDNAPRVVADLSRVTDIGYNDLKGIGHIYNPDLDKFDMSDVGADFVYSGNTPVSFMLPNGLKEIIDFPAWHISDKQEEAYPLFSEEEYCQYRQEGHKDLNFLRLTLDQMNASLLEQLKQDNNLVIVLDTDNAHALAEQRRAFFMLIDERLTHPVIPLRKYPSMEDETFQLYAATDLGGLFVDGLGDGVMLSQELLPEQRSREEVLSAAEHFNNVSFGILQASRARVTKTEYISCPSCGRTQFDLQETTAMIRKRTDHLKGVKIGIMGCIVNGPGEMADADYGYVGTGKGKIALYRGKEIVKRSVPAEHAVDELIEIIKEDGNWIEPPVASS